MYLSFIIPVYNEEKNLIELYHRLNQAVQRNDLDKYEIIFIDDGSEDSSYAIIKDLAASKKEIKAIKFSRNFGEQAAMMAGIEQCEGGAALIMDADLQDDPDSIDKLFAKYKEGFDIVYAVREKRSESFFRRQCFFLFHKIISRIANIPIPENTGSFSLNSRRVLDEIKKMGEYRPYIPGLRAYVGFKMAGVKVPRNKRYAGKQKSFRQLFKLAQNSFFSYSFFPFKLISFIAIFNILAVVAMSFFIIYKRLILGEQAQFGLLLLNILFLNTLQLLCFVIIGKYIAIILEDTKKRPRYIIEEKINF